MNTLKKIIVFSSIMLLATGAFIGCDREEQAVTDQTQQEQEEVASRQMDDQEQRATEEMQQKEEATSAEVRGETEQRAYEQSQQAGEQTQTTGEMAGGTQEGHGLIGKTVMSSDGRELGEVSELEATGKHTGYVFIKGEDDKLHPVPANLLEDDAQGGGLKSAFDQNAFEGSPSFSESELENISDSQLEEVRGYYQENANQ